MSRMDRARRRGGLLWIGAGVVFELGWAAFAGLRPGPITLVIAGGKRSLLGELVGVRGLHLAAPGGSSSTGGVVAAVFATAVEVVLALLLVSGAQRRWVGKATAGLFVVYLVSMTLTVGPGAVAAYALPILVGGALLVSAIPAREPLAGRDRGAVASWDSQ